MALSNGVKITRLLSRYRLPWKAAMANELPSGGDGDGFYRSFGTSTGKSAMLLSSSSTFEGWAAMGPGILNASLGGPRFIHGTACKDYYDVLCVSRSAHLSEIVKDFNALAKKHHADEDEADAENKFDDNQVTVSLGVRKEQPSFSVGNSARDEHLPGEEHPQAESGGPIENLFGKFRSSFSSSLSIKWDTFKEKFEVPAASAAPAPLPSPTVHTFKLSQTWLRAFALTVRAHMMVHLDEDDWSLHGLWPEVPTGHHTDSFKAIAQGT